MNNKSRTTNSIINSIIGVVSQGSSIILNFVTRLVFVKCLNEEYLGVNGLFSNILTVLSLAELGVGTAIIYSLYKPVADKDELKISALLNYYRKAYQIIGIIITVLGLLLTPFLNVIIKDQPDIQSLQFIYVLFLSNKASSYLFAYRRAIFSADQRESVLLKCRLAFSIIRAILQCVILLTTKNFILFLIIQILCTIGENALVYYYSDRYYPFIKLNKRIKLDKRDLLKIKNDIKSLMIYKIGSTVLDGTDNIILSAFVGVVWVGKLSNYTLISGAVSMLATQIITSITGSVGNFIATEKKTRYEELLLKILYLSFIIYGFSFVCLNCLSTPFVELVFGNNYKLDTNIVFVLSLNFYIFGMMNSIWTFRTTMGLFKYGKYRPLVSAVINVVVSILLAKKIGMIGVLIGTTITRVITNVWYDPYIVYKYGLKLSSKKYYFRWMEYLLLSIISIFICEFLFKYIMFTGILSFVLKCFVCVFSFVISTFIFTSKQKEFKSLENIFKNKIQVLNDRIHK